MSQTGCDAGNKRPLPVLGSVAAPLPYLGPAKSEQVEGWTVGRNCPSIHRGGRGDGSVSLQAHQLVCNAFENLTKSKLCAQLCSAVELAGRRVEEVSPAGCVGALLGIPLKTVRTIVRRSNSESQPISASATTMPSKPLAPAQPPEQIDGRTRDVHRCAPVGVIEKAVTAANGSSLAQFFSSQALAGSFADTYATLAIGRNLGVESKLAIAMRNGSLCSMLIVNGFTLDLYPKLVNLMDAHLPRAFGELNHSTRFATGFRTSLTRALTSVQTTALYSIIPAVRVPSDFVRTFDAVTMISGDTLFIAM